MQQNNAKRGCLVLLVIAAAIIAVSLALRPAPLSSTEQVLRALGKNLTPEDMERWNEGVEKGRQETLAAMTGSAAQAGAASGDAADGTIRARVRDQYLATTVDRITLNDNLGTADPGDRIALVYLTWSMPNSAQTSREMLRRYSDDLATTVGAQCPDISELAVFWTVPYLGDASAKRAYARRGSGMYLADEAWGRGF